MGRTRTISVGLAAGGIVGGHALVYALAYPIAAARGDHLRETGHAAFPLLAVMALAGTAVALAGTFIRAARRGGLGPGLGSLLNLQIFLFVLLELVERGFRLDAALSDPAVLLGLPVQALLAFLLAGLARGVAAVATHLLRAPAPARATRPASHRRPARVAEPLPPDLSALGRRRAPPLLASA